MLYSLGQSLEKSKHAVFTGTVIVQQALHQCQNCTNLRMCMASESTFSVV